MNIHIEQWDEEKFYDARQTWNELLSRSSSDPLFLSWEWQSTWWKKFSKKSQNNTKNTNLNLFVATTDDGTIIGIAPLFSCTVKIKNIFTSKRLQFIGNFWRGKQTMPSELLSFIVDRNYTKETILQLYSHIKSLKTWDEFIIPYINLQSDTYKVLTNQIKSSDYYLRHAEYYCSYYLSTDGDFKDYINKRGKNTRLKLLNRRKVLEKLGKISFVNLENHHIEENFERLNTLHQQRWGKTIFEGERLAFNLEVAKLFAEKNCLNFSTLSLNDKLISIQYNFIVDNKNYNLQAGFDENFHKKISLGYLHFGYEIEFCFTSKTLCYDFLAGNGKNTDYKSKLTDTHHNMADIQIIRHPILKSLYKLHHLLKKILDWK